jgi:hypothetical protein
MGRSSTGVTDRVYGHWSREAAKAEAKAMEGVFGVWLYARLYAHQSRMRSLLYRKASPSGAFLMGRAGIEPATLGLKVPCSTD